MCRWGPWINANLIVIRLYTGLYALPSRSVKPWPIMKLGCRSKPRAARPVDLSAGRIGRAVLHRGQKSKGGQSLATPFFVVHLGVTELLSFPANLIFPSDRCTREVRGSKPRFSMPGF